MKLSISLFMLAIVFIVLDSAVWAQEFTRQDTLRGSLTPERSWWDLQHYKLSVEVLPEEKMIKGSNEVSYLVSIPHNKMQIDLQPPMKITRAIQNDQELEVDSEGSAHFIHLTESQNPGDIQKLTLFFEGQPREARQPPWDGGFTWEKDSNGKHFIATSNQGIGASIWWPNKDHPADEPDKGILMLIEVPQDLMDVSNGRLIKTEKNRKKRTKIFHWEVTQPINNYGVNINVGDYVHFGEEYEGEKGFLDMDYYVLRENLEKAKEHFKDARRTMQAFEHWFGPYPFYEDSYKLVEVPYLGMEHQSSVTYGNGYQNGYLGRDLSQSGWGLKWDFIIVHESGHEWFANNITYQDVADMWIHEGFTAYSENLYLDYHFGTEASGAYVRGTRMNIRNDRPIIGTYGVNKRGSGDMYSKGANLLHTIRNIIDDDENWRTILRGLNEEFYHQTVTTSDVEKYISDKSGIELSKVFDQYLRDIRIPILEYETRENQLFFRWINAIPGFNMPVDVRINDEVVRLSPSDSWDHFTFGEEIKSFTVDPDFYVGSSFIKGH